MSIDLIKKTIESKERGIYYINTKPQDNRIVNVQIYRTNQDFPSLGAIIGKNDYILADAETAHALINKYAFIDPEPIADCGIIKAQVLPYIQNSAGETTIIDPTVNMVVTAPLTGCTVTAQLDSTQPHLSHANFTNDNGEIDQISIDQYIETAHKDEAVLTVKKDAYKTKTDRDIFQQASFFGFCGKEGWEYKTQQITVGFDEHNNYTFAYDVLPNNTAKLAKEKSITAKPKATSFDFSTHTISENIVKAPPLCTSTMLESAITWLNNLMNYLQPRQDHSPSTNQPSKP